MYPVAHVGSLVEVDGKIGKVITGAPKHMVTGASGGGGSGGSPEVAELIGQETEDMTPSERRAYIETKFGPGAADAYERAVAEDPPTTEVEALSAPDVRSRQIGCEGIQNSTPDSFKISKYFRVADLSSATYQFPHTIANVTPAGLSRADTICNLKHLAMNTLDPLRDWLPRAYPGHTFKISSGYRPGSGRSDHDKGSAADIHFFNGGARVSRSQLRQITLKFLNEARIPFTQLILEFNGRNSSGWMHIANRKTGGNSSLRIAHTFTATSGSYRAGIPTEV